MRIPLNEQGRDLLFRQARTHRHWLNEPVSDETLRELYELMKFAPTSANTFPVRVVFIRTPEGKQRLKPALAAGNVDKTMAAPVTAILAYDSRFYEQIPKLVPSRPQMRERFAEPEIAPRIALQGGTLQAAYFILAARAVGLDCGPMGGFDNTKVDAEFFIEGSGMEGWRSNILCNLGHGDDSHLHARDPRLDFEEACRLL
jgi:3-hydroxypropanoate dehydrogenase